YGLAYIASRRLNAKDEATVKEQMLVCLSRDYAMAAAKLGAILWRYVPPKKVLTAQQAKDPFPPQDRDTGFQPPFPTIDRKFRDVVRGLTRAGQSAEPLSEHLLEIWKLSMDSAVLITDNTDAWIFRNDISSFDPRGLAHVFKDKEYLKFGCASEMKSTFGENPEGAKATFLALKAPAGAGSTTFENVVVVRPLFRGGLVARLVIYDDIDIKKAVLEDHQWKCDGFAVVKPS